LLSLYRLQPGLTIEVTTVNGLAGLAFRDETGQTLGIASVAISHGVIRRIWVTRNPGKLTAWT
jgi:hypothetical protein